MPKEKKETQKYGCDIHILSLRMKRMLITMNYDAVDATNTVSTSSSRCPYRIRGRTKVSIQTS